MHPIRSLLDQIQRNPSLPALAGCFSELTFGSLGLRAGAIQARLRQWPPGTMLIHGHKETETVAAMLACSVESRPFCFVDRSHPVARIAQVGRIADAVGLIACSSRVPEVALAVLGSRDCVDLPLQQWERPATDSVFYYIFTSGSTGEPKGIAIHHGNFAAFDVWYGAQLNIIPGDGFHLNHANLAFDLGMGDLWPCLARGRAVLMLDHANNALPRQNLRLMQGYSGRLLSGLGTPSFLSTLCRDPLFEQRQFPALADLYLAGEVIPPALFAQLQQRFPGTRLWNGYGPSETTCLTHTQLLAGHALSAAQLSCFEPGSARCRVEVWNTAGEPAWDEPGEVVIFGPQVAAGYLPTDLPQNRAFVEHNGERCYRSGDRGTLDAAGNLWLRGRSDRQIKINGNRVELPEIELRALCCHGVNAAVVVVRCSGDRTELLLFVGGTTSSLALREYLARHLPPYMLPHQIHCRDRLPFNRNGKIDSARLLNETVRQEHP
jgi:D-alanine--poly(phosphoribitol) ligase subunit 1